MDAVEPRHAKPSFWQPTLDGQQNTPAPSVIAESNREYFLKVVDARITFVSHSQAV